jgi:hypothetical protein
MTHAGGRSRKTFEGLTIPQWLKGFLSGGSQSSVKIRRLAEARGVKWRTVTRAKRELGCIDAIKVGYVWHWRDRGIAPKTEPKAAIITPLSKSEKVIANGVTDTAKDKDGFSTATPKSLGLFDGESSILITDIMRRIESKMKEGWNHADIIYGIFNWAYPAADISESEIKGLLVSGGVFVPSRSKPSELCQFEPERSTDEEPDEIPF